MARFETWMIWRYKFIYEENVRYFSKNKSFKNFTANQKHINWAIIFDILFIALFVKGNNNFFPIQKKNLQKEELV